MAARPPDRAEPLQVAGEMTIYSAAAIAERVFAAVKDASGAARLDLSQVTDIDTAGLQILLMARKLARAQGRAAVVDPNSRVEALLRLCRLDDMIAGGPRPDSAS